MHGSSVVVCNPLPRALAHYEAEVTATLGRLQLAAIPSDIVSMEGVRGFGARAGAAAKYLQARARLARGGGPSIVLWPGLGFVDMALSNWLPHGNSLLVVHDVMPLRPQVGTGRASRLVAAASRCRPSNSLLVHSQRGADELASLGLGTARIILHPISIRNAAVQAPQNPRIGVFGMYKPSRRVDVLMALPNNRDIRDFDFTVAGRGWPQMAGWDVTSEWLNEEELERRIRTCSLILIPYSDYYQSGVAIRAMELGIPVIGVRHEQLITMYGPNWSGICAELDTNCISEAALRSLAVERHALSAMAFDYQSRADATWSAALGPGT